MSDGPFFTVVVATFDRGQHIIPTIESALGQTFKDFELLIIRDGAKDNVLERVTYMRVSAQLTFRGIRAARRHQTTSASR